METIIDEDLPMQVDCVQWHPNCSEIIAVGAYQLSSATTDTRLGRLYLLQLTPKVPGGFSVVLEHETAGGVLDLKFQPTNKSTSDVSNPTPIAIATSSGLYIFTLEISPDFSEFTLSPIASIETGILALYLQWLPGADGLIFSDAEGYLNIVQGGEDSYKVSSKKKLHDALTWTCHFATSTEILYAGCDDGKFTACYFGDLMRDEVHFVKKYEVGVTSINSWGEIVAVGGYDDILNLYQTNPAQFNQKPSFTPLTSLNLSGAVWRTQFLSHPNPEILVIVVATARKGVKFVHYNKSQNKLSVVKEMMKYEGFLAYGLDVGVDEQGQRWRVASGYFDNKVVQCFWVGW